jgi:hypothetical protein
VRELAVKMAERASKQVLKRHVIALKVSKGKIVHKKNIYV